MCTFFVIFILSILCQTPMGEIFAKIINDLKKLAKNVLMYRKCFCMFGNNFILKNYIDQLPMYHVSNYQLLSFSCKKSKKSGRISENHLQRDFFGMHVGLNSCANIR